MDELKVSNNYVGGYITKLLQKHSYNSLLAAYPLLSIFSVLEDMNNSVWYTPRNLRSCSDSVNDSVLFQYCIQY